MSGANTPVVGADREALDFGYALARIRGMLQPPVVVTPPPSNVRCERDVEVKVRDGTILRVNVFRPPGTDKHPVIMCAHPYGKDNLPRQGFFGYRPLAQFRLLRQSAPISISAWTGWEAPDPAFWVPRGYAVVNCDLRGFFRSDGEAELISDAEAQDYFDLIEWAAAQPWSTGRVGLNGVSYLALSQWKVAALHPPHLAAICPWEGFTDLYRDLAYPGGIREDGFIAMWNRGVRRAGRIRFEVRAEQLVHPVWDDFWAARVAALERIEVPALICGSFSDHNLHTRGSFEGFRRISSRHRWLYTHRDGKWAAYYSADALAFQARFFDCFLKDAENGMRNLPPVRLEVRDTADTVVAVRQEESWPLARSKWTRLYLHADGTLGDAHAAAGRVEFDATRQAARFRWTVLRDTELTGPMKLRLHVEMRGANDVHIFAGVRKLRAGTSVPFEGSYGYGRDMITKGWLRASHRRLDATQSAEWRPVHTHRDPQPLQSGEIVGLDIELRPSSTLLRRNDVLRLDIQGRWFFRKHPLFGEFPADYEPSPPGIAVLHLGGDHDAYLLVPIIPEDTPASSLAPPR